MKLILCKEHQKVFISSEETIGLIVDKDFIKRIYRIERCETNGFHIWATRYTCECGKPVFTEPQLYDRKWYVKSHCLDCVKEDPLKDLLVTEIRKEESP